MAALLLRRPGGTARLEPIAVAWGGLAASIGLMTGAGRDWPARLALSAVAFLLGGFLAGVRSGARRTAHAVAAWVAGYAIHACFIAIARTIDAFGGRSAPALVPGTGRDWVVAALWALGFALLGGRLANSWLRPAARQPR